MKVAQDVTLFDLERTSLLFLSKIGEDAGPPIHAQMSFVQLKLINGALRRKRETLVS